MKARYVHDCDDCRFLEVNQYGDWYICPQVGLSMPTLLCRYSSDGPDYWSMSPDTIRSVVFRDQCTEIMWRAKEICLKYGLGG